MKTATKEALSEGDLVYLKDDPTQARGVLVEGNPNKGQWYVSWFAGGTWIFPSEDLALVES